MLDLINAILDLMAKPVQFILITQRFEKINELNTQLYYAYVDEYLPTITNEYNEFEDNEFTKLANELSHDDNIAHYHLAGAKQYYEDLKQAYINITTKA